MNKRKAERSGPVPTRVTPEGNTDDDGVVADEAFRLGVGRQQGADPPPTEIFTVLAAWHRVHVDEGHEDEGHEDEQVACATKTGDPCGPVKFAPGPEQIVHFRQSLALETLPLSGWDPVEGIAPPTYGCVSFASGGLRVEFALDLRYEQRWFHQATLIGALSAATSLAPGETLSLTVRNTQRKLFDQQTVDESEQILQNDSTTADKESISVTHSSSKSNNWTVSANASVSLPAGLGAGVGASMSQSVNEASNSSAQRLHDSTQKSASSLKTLHKVDIRQTTETTAENTTARRVVNPYRDRSLRIDVYDLVKDYCVEFHLVQIVPVLLLTLDQLIFDERFVKTNGGFLFDELVDRYLQTELTEAMEAVIELPAIDREARARKLALIALDYLFAGPSVFNWPQGDVPDANDPGTSFLDFGPGLPDALSGLHDATANRLGIVFSTLAVYYQLYRGEVLVGGDEQLATELVMSLDAVLAPRWIGVEETDNISNVIDRNEFTEVLRRLAGFLTMTSGIIRPLLQPVEEEREAHRQAVRTRFVIQRVIEHLNCHSSYYTSRYLNYISNQTRGASVSKLVNLIVRDFLVGAAGNVNLFDADASFVDGARVIVPMRGTLDVGTITSLFAFVDNNPVDVKTGLLNVLQTTVPTDGMHIEVVPGHCRLADVGAPETMGPVHVRLETD